jgi:tetratricopeptide (TPR) repeat protein
MVECIYEDNHISVHAAPAPGGGPADVAVLSYCPMNHDFAAKGIPAMAALHSLKFDVFGIIARQNNWYPQASLHKAAAVLRPRLAGYRQRVAYGSSMGAYGAIKYSALLGCDHVLALAPQWSIDPGDVAPWDTRFSRHFSGALHAGMRIVPQDVAGRIAVVADPMLAADLRHVHEIAACGDCALIPAYFCDHYVVNPIASRKTLAALFDAVLKDDLDRARAVYRQARKDSEYYRGALMHALARRRLRQGRLDAALRAGQAAVAAMPKQGDFLVTLSRIHAGRKDRAAAIAVARQAVEVDPGRAWYRQILQEAEAL